MEQTSLKDEQSSGVLMIRIADPEASDAEVPSGEEIVENAFETRFLGRLREAIERNRPDVILVDLRLPIQRGAELMRAMTAICPDAEILTRVSSRLSEPRFFSVRPSFRGLSLEPLGPEALDRLPPSLLWAEASSRRNPIAKQLRHGGASEEIREIENLELTNS